VSATWRNVLWRWAKRLSLVALVLAGFAVAGGATYQAAATRRLERT
jgi:hypothetical protein